jgi:beta-N-acetylhexosaminidase
MLAPLSPPQQEWVRRTLASMTIQQCVGHLLCPEDRTWQPKVKPYGPRDYKALLRHVPIGTVFVYGRQGNELRDSLRALQDLSPVPVLVAADIENGWGSMGAGGVTFPSPMAYGAARKPELARRTGAFIARQARASGVHWSFAPVVDLNVNFQNPVTNSRAFGDDAALVARLARARIEGMQAGGLLAATAKHFPGDGMDDRDQHICTSINPLSMRRWHSTYGRVWRWAIEAGVMSVMVGHIALPAWQRARAAAALPATLDQRLQVDLLRRRLGFEGVVVSDAISMIGLTSRCPHADIAVRNIETGSDVVLFANPRRDFEAIMRALKNGRLTERRVVESARRVLELKARLNVHVDPFGPPPTAPERNSARALADEVAARAVTVARAGAPLGRPLAPGAKVATIAIRYGKGEFKTIDAELRRRGYRVESLVNPSHGQAARAAAAADRVFVNIAIGMHSRIGTIRLTGELVNVLWDGWWSDKPNVVFTSLGSPYLLYELPHLPNLLLTYSADESSQRAAVAAWLGEAPARGKPPMKLP